MQCFCVQTGGTNFKVFTVVHFILEFTVHISVNMFTEVGTGIMFLFSLLISLKNQPNARQIECSIVGATECWLVLTEMRR